MQRGEGYSKQAGVQDGQALGRTAGMTPMLASNLPITAVSSGNDKCQAGTLLEVASAFLLKHPRVFVDIQTHADDKRWQLCASQA